MMREQFGVIPADLRAVSRHCSDLAARVRGVGSRCREKVDGEGTPWGPDNEIGRQWYDGEAGAGAQLAVVLDSCDAQADLLEYYAELLKTVADSSEYQDQV